MHQAVGPPEGAGRVTGLIGTQSQPGSATRKRRGMAMAAAMTALLALAGCQGVTASRNDPNRGSVPLNITVLAELDAKQMTRHSPIFMRIFKEEAELEVWKKDRTGRYAHFKTYPICKYSGELGPKIREGDRQAPEGFYMVGPQHMNPHSSFFLSFNLGFPNAFDRAHGRTGSHLMVHGDCSSRGCYAMTDEAIAEVYALARDALAAGQPAFQVQALPFRMTPQNLARHRNSPHMAFWKNLKAGSDHFEVTRLEPQVDVCERRYVFNAVSPASPLASLPASNGPVEMVSRASDPWGGLTQTGRRGASSAVVTTTAPQSAVPTSVNQPVTQMAPVTRAAPGRVTAVSLAGERPRFEASGRCPAYAVPPAIQNAVAAKHARDLREVAALTGSLAAAPARSGIDGGTHRRFADRFAGRQIRVGSSEPALAFLGGSTAPELPAPVDATSPRASSGPSTSTTVLVAAPVPAPSPLRQAVATAPALATPSPAATAATASPGAPSTAPAATGLPATTVVTRSPAGQPATTAAPPAAPAASASAEPPTETGNWFTRMIGTSSPAIPAAAAPAAEVAPTLQPPLPAARPQAAATDRPRG